MFIQKEGNLMIEHNFTGGNIRAKSKSNEQ